MDWNSKEGRKLLFQAFPVGYLAMRGVLTVSGFQCVGLPTERHPLGVWDGRCLWPDLLTDQCAVATRGDLLPLPGLSDLATWACLKADLAKAAGIEDDLSELQWKRMDIVGKVIWGLCRHIENRRGSFIPFYGIDTGDPAEALIRARIQLREDGR